MAHIALERTKIGRPSKSLLMVGLRGVGKTVLLDRIREDAEETGISTLRIEAPEGRSLPSVLAPQLRHCAAETLTSSGRQRVGSTRAQRACRIC